MKKMYTKATPALKELWEKYEGEKWVTTDHIEYVVYFENLAKYSDDSPCCFYGFESHHLDERLEYGYVEVSEREFAKFFDLEKELDEWYPQLTHSPKKPFIDLPSDETETISINESQIVNDNKEDKINPQPHYDNSKGSLYQIAEQRGWNSYQFDIVKRIDRSLKKGQFEEDLKKTKDLIDLWLREYGR